MSDGIGSDSEVQDVIHAPSQCQLIAATALRDNCTHFSWMSTSKYESAM